jgi:hypothetical protein
VAPLVAILALSGCPGPEESETEPLFPEDYAAEWTMVHDCRRSIEHDLTFVRIWADPTSVDTYTSREGELPEGSTLLKEEFGDAECSDLIGWTVMMREAGFAPAAGDWRWQRVRDDRFVTSDGSLPECFLCHEHCGQPPDGFDWTCVIPSE